MLRTGICGTDLHIESWDRMGGDARSTRRSIPGHEFCGEVVEVGDRVRDVQVGDLV